MIVGGAPVIQHVWAVLGDEGKDGGIHRNLQLLASGPQDGDTDLQLRGLDVGQQPPLEP